MEHRLLQATLSSLAETLGPIAKMQTTTTLSGRDDDDERRRSRLGELALALEALVGETTLRKAMEISSYPGAVVEYRAACGRVCATVTGPSGHPYRVWQGYCGCFDFARIRVGGPLPVCKHILALELARIQGAVELVNLDDEAWCSRVAEVNGATPSFTPPSVTTGGGGESAALRAGYRRL